MKQTRASRMIPRIGAAAAAIAMTVNVAPSAAAISIGQAVAPASGCGGPLIGIQTTSPQSFYAAPTDGVLTSWSYRANATAPAQLQLKVARAAGGNDFTIVGQSQFESTSANQLNTFATRVPVRAGDVIGIFFPNGSSGGCAANPASDYGVHVLSGDAAPGTTTTFMQGAMLPIDVAAVLEADCDSDGIGDETQDQLVDCVPPETQITKGPKDRTSKKKAKFEFSANEPGATFECSLDGGAFAACSSPHKVKVRKGKHSFAVRAKDAGSNVDGSPATDDWKVRKKKK